MGNIKLKEGDIVRVRNVVALTLTEITSSLCRVGFVSDSNDVVFNEGVNERGPLVNKLPNVEMVQRGQNRVAVLPNNFREKGNEGIGIEIRKANWWEKKKFRYNEKYPSGNRRSG